ncbi:MAG: zinc dependent phospholipase C family protein [Clostridia bacterium]|nr:zinc dependent phospholipase C family protein [Clostridia bacterium]
MPALYAHLRFGEEVSKTLPAPLQDLVKKYPEAFALGTQGPDILFYHHPLKKNEIRKYGTELHEKTAFEVFSAAGEKRTDEPSAYNAYLCGFLCHFTLDLFCHPYIDQTMNDKVTHGKIESEFDKFLLRKDGKPIRGYNTATPIKDENGTREAAALLLGVPQENIAVAIKTMKKINGWFSKKCELFHTFVHALLRLANMERKFGDMFLHKKDDSLCETPNRVLEEKFGNAIAPARELITAYFNEVNADGKPTLSDPVFEKYFRYDFSGNKPTEEF